MVYRQTRRNRLIPILFSLAALLGLVYVLAGIPLSKAREAWEQQDSAGAIERLESWKRLRLRPADYEHLLVVAHLSAGRNEQAVPYLRQLAQRPPFLRPVVDKADVGRRLVAQGRYEAFLEYDTAVQQRFESETLPLYRAAAQLGAGRIPEAETTFSTLRRGVVEAGTYERFERALAERKQGAFPLVLDREGKTIAAWQLANRDLVPVDAPFGGLIDRSVGPATVESRLDELGTHATIETTLDSAIQRAALAALGSSVGAIVAIDPRNHELLAAAFPAESHAADIAFGSGIEAGSVVKVLTALALIQSEASGDIFPIDCRGFLVLNDRQFFDWARHGEVSDLDDAMAVSCNVAFARMGLELGAERMQDVMRRARFGDHADLGLFRVPLGEIVGSLETDYEVASFAVGLDHHRLNALHLAMIGDMLANRGVMSTPVLLRARRSILGDAIGEAPRFEPVRIATAAQVQQIIEAMRAVITDPRGTGRRAAIDGLDYVIKTGTAGERPYEALIVGFAPADEPRIAFGIIAEDVGPAEIAGARITRDFLTRILPRLR